MVPIIIEPHQNSNIEANIKKKYIVPINMKAFELFTQIRNKLTLHAS